MASPRDGITDVSYGPLEAADQLTHPLLRRLHDEWCAAMLPGNLPGHGFADPLKLQYLLGQMAIVGVVRTEAGGMRFNYRLVGTDLVARRHRDTTGHWMDEHEDRVVAALGPPACGLVVEARRPVHVTANRRIDGKSYPVEYLLLPLAEDEGDGIDRVLIAQLYSADTPRLPYRGAAP